MTTYFAYLHDPLQKLNSFKVYKSKRNVFHTTHNTFSNWADKFEYGKNKNLSLFVEPFFFVSRRLCTKRASIYFYYYHYYKRYKRDPRNPFNDNKLVHLHNKICWYYCQYIYFCGILLAISRGPQSLCTELIRQGLTKLKLKKETVALMVYLTELAHYSAGT